MFEVVVQLSLSFFGIGSNPTLQDVEQMVDSVYVWVLRMSLSLQLGVSIGVFVGLLHRSIYTLFAVRIASTS